MNGAADAAPDAAPAGAPEPEALQPVRAALLRTAQEEADTMLRAAGEAAAAAAAEAGRRAAALLEQARRQGEADGRAAGAAELLRARRAARARVLAARAEAYAELRGRVTARVREVRRTPGYPRLRARLADRARGLLGPRAAVREHPGGGVVGTAPGRLADLGLDALACRALDRIGAEVQQLWEP